MKIIVLKSKEDFNLNLDKLVYVLKECDNDFYRPLSETVDVIGSLEDKLKEVLRIKSLGNTEFICMFTESNDLIGYTIINLNYPLPISTDILHSHYISLTVISPRYRNLGYASKLYTAIEDTYSVIEPHIISRRTWSLNEKQQYLYAKLGYDMVWTDLNHKDVNVHSIYYMKNFADKLPETYIKYNAILE